MFFFKVFVLFCCCNFKTFTKILYLYTFTKERTHDDDNDDDKKNKIINNLTPKHFFCFCFLFCKSENEAKCLFVDSFAKQNKKKIYVGRQTSGSSISVICWSVPICICPPPGGICVGDVAAAAISSLDALLVGGMACYFFFFFCFKLKHFLNLKYFTFVSMFCNI